MKIEMPGTWSEVQPLLLPKVRERYFLARADESPKLYRCLGSDLGVGVTLDHPKLVIYVTVPMLTDWGVSADEVFEAAFDNLTRRTPGTPFELLEPGLYRSPWQDGYDATRLVLPSTWKGLELHGKPIAVALNRSKLLLTGSNDTEGLAAMLKSVRQEINREQLLTPIPMARSAEQWRAYVPEDAGWRDVIDTHWAELYREQSLELESFNKERGGKTQVALLLPVRQGERLLFTLTNWPKLGPQAGTLLPVAQWVTVGAVGDPRLRACSWDDTLRCFGAYLQEQPGFPTRFRTRGFPTDEELSAAPSAALQELITIP